MPLPPGKRLIASWAIFDVPSLTNEKSRLEEAAGDSSLWNDPQKASVVLKEKAAIERKLQTAKQLSGWSDDVGAFVDLMKEGEEMAAELKKQLDEIRQPLLQLELTLKLNEPNDDKFCLLSIHAGAGGTESQDWAQMLLRMYLRWCERKGFKAEALEYQDGEEAGIKSATLRVQGEYAFGHLKAESGVHRLVRISPFDAAARRHTSFASVYAYPEIDESIEIDIQEKDLRIDTYRSSGAGGQHVNVTDSAVRITHTPTNTVVTCQNERSQTRNREMAMKMLRARLYDQEVKKKEVEQAKREGAKKEIGFGSQIRSYVLAPYRLIKDHRTDTEVGDVDRVLDGDIDPFIEAYLRQQIAERAAGTAK